MTHNNNDNGPSIIKKANHKLMFYEFVTYAIVNQSKHPRQIFRKFPDTKSAAHLQDCRDLLAHLVLDHPFHELLHVL
jgi:hypothetical protein